MATKKTRAKKPVGRPSKFTQELADTICDRLAGGESLRKICSGDDMPAGSTVWLWLSENKLFSEQYARAREAQADKLADEIIEIADDGRNDTYQGENGEAVNHDVIARSRLRVDARKWYASKLAPKKYGDKVTQEHTGRIDGELSLIKRVIVDPKNGNSDD